MRYLAFFALALAAGALSAQQLYRWTDKDGKTHYGATPPAGVAAKAVKGTANTAVAQQPIQDSSDRSRPSKHPNASALGRDGDAPPRIDPKKQY